MSAYMCSLLEDVATIQFSALFEKKQIAYVVFRSAKIL